MLMRALDAGGERAVALQHARVYEQLVREGLDAAPEPAAARASSSARVEPAMPNEVVGGAPVASRRTLVQAIAVCVAAFGGSFDGTISSPGAAKR